VSGRLSLAQSNLRSQKPHLILHPGATGRWMRPALPWSPPKQGCSLAAFVVIIGQPLAMI